MTTARGRLGAVIAGGAASRFGADKAMAQWRGRPMIAHAGDALAPWCEAVVVAGVVPGRTWPASPAIPDLPRAGLGPLGGIAAALGHAARHGFASVLTIGCDMPDVPPELMARLAAGAPACCPDAPILGHWPAALGPALAERLAGHAPGAKDGRLSIRRWAEAVGAVPVAAHGPLTNVNTRADLPA